MGIHQLSAEYGFFGGSLNRVSVEQTVELAEFEMHQRKDTNKIW